MNNNLFLNIRKSLSEIKSNLVLKKMLTTAQSKVLTRNAIDILMKLKYQDDGYTLSYPKESDIHVYMPEILEILYDLHLVYIASEKSDMPNWPQFLSVNFKLTPSGAQYVSKALPDSSPNIQKQELEVDLKQDSISQIQTERDYADANDGNPIVPMLISGAGILLGGLIAICTQGLWVLAGFMLIIGSISFYVWTLMIGYGHENDAIDQKSDREVPKLNHQIQKLRDSINEAYQHIYKNCECSLLDFILIGHNSLSNTYYSQEQLYNWMTQVMFTDEATDIR